MAPGAGVDHTATARRPVDFRSHVSGDSPTDVAAGRIIPVAAFREGEVVHRMSLLYRLHLSRIRKHFQGVLPDRLEHQQTWLISSSVALLQQAFVKQGCN